MKILIVGLGSIGKRHAKILKELNHDVFALRTFKGQEENSHNMPELNSWKQVDEHRFDAAVISNPTFLHIETALECAKRNMHLFLEKPIDCKTNGLEELIQLVEQKKLTAYVAYPLRFHPLILELKKRLQGQTILNSRVVCASYMPNWRSKQNHKTSYSSFREQGGGVLLDSSHEIDYIEYLFGEIKDIQGSFGRQSTVTVDAEDFCDLTLSHPQGVTHLHMDLFSMNTQRFAEVNTEESYIKADLNAFQLIIKDKAGEQTIDFPADLDLMFRTQMSYFLDHLNDKTIQNNLETAARLFRKVLQFRNGKEYSHYPMC